MKSSAIVLPNQLFEFSPLLNLTNDFFLVEEELFFKQFNFHKIKLGYHVATMYFYRDYLLSQGKNVFYQRSGEGFDSIESVLFLISKQGYKILFAIDPVDNWVEKRLKKFSNLYNLELNFVTNNSFIFNNSDLEKFFELNKDKNYFRQIDFYIYARKKLGLFIDDKGKPFGGKWSFDKENRKRLNSSLTIPNVKFFNNKYWQLAYQRVLKDFKLNYGDIPRYSYYPVTFEEAKQSFFEFLVKKLLFFGDYQDFIDVNNSYLFHSNLSAAINIGLIEPNFILKELINYYQKNLDNISFNNVEGYLRQLIGWREFIRFVYLNYGVNQRNSNFFNLNNKNIYCFYNINTGIYPLDFILNKLHKLAYLHHIERLMILGNYMLLLRINPHKAYEFFMSTFIDAYDWVMVPNLYGMSLFADGGLMSTKPYLCSSNYIKKMSNFPKGNWELLLDSLFWRFIYDYKDFFIKQPRLSKLLGHLQKRDIIKDIKTSDDLLSKFQ